MAGAGKQQVGWWDVHGYVDAASCPKPVDSMHGTPGCDAGQPTRSHCCPSWRRSRRQRHHYCISAPPPSASPPAGCFEVAVTQLLNIMSPSYRQCHPATDSVTQLPTNVSATASPRQLSQVAFMHHAPLSISSSFTKPLMAGCCSVPHPQRATSAPPPPAWQSAPGSTARRHQRPPCRSWN